jgi:hypothetical protein
MTKKEKDAPKADTAEAASDPQGSGDALASTAGGTDLLTTAAEDDGDGEIELPESAAGAAVFAASRAPSGLVRALVLRSCGFGEAGDVVSLNEGEAETGADQGTLDLSPAAVRSVAG